MSNDTPITVVGNLVADPDLKFVPSGRAVATVRVASTPRFQDRATGEWKDSPTLFLTCTIWGPQAENTAESLTRGTEVIVSGRLKQRSYETQEGERRTVVELDAEYIGPCLRKATAKVTKAQRYGGTATSGEPVTDPWANQAASPPTDPWANAPVPAGVGAVDPPF